MSDFASCAEKPSFLSKYIVHSNSATASLHEYCLSKRKSVHMVVGDGKRDSTSVRDAPLGCDLILSALCRKRHIASERVSRIATRNSIVFLPHSTHTYSKSGLVQPHPVEFALVLTKSELLQIIYMTDGFAYDVIAQEMARAQSHPPGPPTPVVIDVSHVWLPLLTTTNDLVTKEPMGSSWLPSLPNELLLTIFRWTQPPTYQHDPSIVLGPRNPWLASLRTRKALVLTCKSFYGPASEVLYEDVVLRRMGQIPALARTLGPLPDPRATTDFACLIKSIRMNSCVIWAPCAEVVREDLRLILQRCTSLRTFSFQPHPHFPFADDLDGGHCDGFNPTWLLKRNPNAHSVAGSLFLRLNTSLRSIDLAVTLDEPMLMNLHSLLHGAPYLTFLKLGVASDAQPYTAALFALTPLRLPSLTELQLHTGYGPFTQYISNSWQLPRLSHLTAYGCTTFPEALLAAHGSRLTYLHTRYLYDSPHDSPAPPALAALPTLCPVLEHLAVPAWPGGPSAIASPTLRFADIWIRPTSNRAALLRAGWRSAGTAARLPRLERVRLLSPGPAPRIGPAPPWPDMLVPPLDLPRICAPDAPPPPTLEGEVGRRVWAFPGVQVVELAWGVLNDYGERKLIWGREREYGPLEDAEYCEFELQGGGGGAEMEEEDGEEEEGATEDEDDIAELLRRVPGERAGQLDRGTILAMYEDSQDRVFMFQDFGE